MKPKPNRRRHTPIPGLAQHIAAFNNKRELKAELAAIRAAFADRVYAASVARQSARYVVK